MGDLHGIPLTQMVAREVYMLVECMALYDTIRQENRCAEGLGQLELIIGGVSSHKPRVQA